MRAASSSRARSTPAAVRQAQTPNATGGPSARTSATASQQPAPPTAARASAVRRQGDAGGNRPRHAGGPSNGRAVRPRRPPSIAASRPLRRRRAPRRGAACSLTGRAYAVSAPVADPVDGAQAVVGEEEARRRRRRRGRPAGPRLRPPASQPVAKSSATGRRAVEPHADHLVADGRRAVPGAVERDEEVAAILRRELGPGVEDEPQRSGVRLVEEASAGRPSGSGRPVEVGVGGGPPASSGSTASRRSRPPRRG